MIKYFCDMCDEEVPAFSTTLNYITQDEDGSVSTTLVHLCDLHATSVHSFIQTQKQDGSA